MRTEDPIERLRECVLPSFAYSDVVAWCGELADEIDEEVYDLKSALHLMTQDRDWWRNDSARLRAEVKKLGEQLDRLRNDGGLA